MGTFDHESDTAGPEGSKIEPRDSSEFPLAPKSRGVLFLSGPVARGHGIPWEESSWSRARLEEGDRAAPPNPPFPPPATFPPPLSQAGNPMAHGRRPCHGPQTGLRPILVARRRSRGLSIPFRRRSGW